MPTHTEDYVHRIGRTGRAPATGDAITFVSSEEEKYLREVGKFIGRKLKAQKCKGFSYVKSPPPKPNRPFIGTVHAFRAPHINFNDFQAKPKHKS